MEKFKTSCGKDNNNRRTDTTTSKMVSIRRILVPRLIKSNHLLTNINSNNNLTKEDKKWIRMGRRKSTVIMAVKIRGLIIRTSRIATQRAKTNRYPSTSASETVICRQASRISVTHAISRVWCRHSFTSPIFRKRSWHLMSRTSLRISRIWR